MFATSTAIFASFSHKEVEKARSADSFTDSIGVVIHLNYGDTSYAHYDDIIKPRLKELGVRHIRTNVAPEDIKTQNKLRELANMGIKANLVMDPRKLSLTEAIKLVKTLGNTVVESVEGPNEWNQKFNTNFEYKGKNFPEGLKNYQADLYSAIKSDPATAHLPVLAPSISAGNQLKKSIAQLGKIDCDINNMHSYPGGRIPSTPGLDATFIPYSIKSCGEDKPLIATETGYHNATRHPKGISEEAAARYITRLFLEYFNRGVERTYTYELIDLKPNPTADNRNFNWGLLRSDGTPKKEFLAIRNLIELLKDSGKQTSSSFPLESLDYSLKGDKTNINHTLLQKKDGKFYLILWQEVASYDLETKSNLKVPDRSLELILNTKITKATIYRTNWKQALVKTIADPQKISIEVPDYPLVIELTPK